MERSDFDTTREGAGLPEAGDDGRRAGCIDSQAILGERDEVFIRHGDQMYRLRKTRHGKLILNK
jgi:hemin uptake protein HemP